MIRGHVLEILEKSRIEQRKRRKISDILVILTFNFVITLEIFFGKREPFTILYMDMYAGYYPPEVILRAVISIWSPVDFGTLSQTNLGYLLIFLVQSTVKDPFTSMVIINFLPYWLASLSMYLFLTEQNILENRVMYIFGGILYAYNWVSLRYIGCALWLYAYSSIPLVIHYLSLIHI